MNTFGIGKDKWIGYHFDNDRIRQNDKSNMHSSLDINVPTKLLSYEQACDLAVDEIRSIHTNDTLMIAMSGGCDSETVAKSFYRNNVKFTPVILQLYYYTKHLNYADNWWAHRWCDEHNYTPLVLKYSSSSFYTIMDNYQRKIKSRMFEPLISVLLLDEIKKQGGIGITGESDITYIPDPAWSYLERLRDPSIYNFDKTLQNGWYCVENDFYMDMNDPDYHPYNFLTWNPEMTLSWISNYDTTKTAEYNKEQIMKCKPRPKMGLPDMFQFGLMMERQTEMRRRYGTTDVFYYGTTEQLTKKLRME